MFPTIRFPVCIVLSLLFSNSNKCGNIPLAIFVKSIPI